MKIEPPEIHEERVRLTYCIDLLAVQYDGRFMGMAITNFMNRYRIPDFVCPEVHISKETCVMSFYYDWYRRTDVMDIARFRKIEIS